MRRTASCVSSPVRARDWFCTSRATTGTNPQRFRAATGWTHFDIRPVPDRAAAAPLCPDFSGAAFIGDSLADLASWGLAAHNPSALMRRLDFTRAVKSPYELACLRQASRLGVAGPARRRPRL